jgi:hypothetical protein
LSSVVIKFGITIATFYSGRTVAPGSALFAGSTLRPLFASNTGIAGFSLEALMTAVLHPHVLDKKTIA